MRDPRGALWKKWDLHVHTPTSIVSQQYGADTDETWDRFLSDLRALPSDFKVLGINDYIFIDGYRRVREAHRNGELPNIELILPVVELRIDKFGGTNSKLSRLNWHVIFSDELDPALIQAQFLSRLTAGFRLDSQHNAVTWSGVPTLASLRDLGAAIIESVPLEERARFGSPAEEGFNSLCLSLDVVRDALSSPYFKGQCLQAVGKTEWESIKWNGQSIGVKKDLINSADFLFTSAETGEAALVGRQSLVADGVNARVLDCSDAHDFSTAGTKDRIGKCFTWICADTTFAGLRQARLEYDSRVFLGGGVPPAVSRVKNRSTMYLDSIELRKVGTPSGVGPWFDGVSLPLNHGLVAVIGNKGSGKSALLDVLALAGGSRRMSDAAFLTPRRFNSAPQPLGRHFRAELGWASGERFGVSLIDVPGAGTVERVQYIPQGLFEKICNPDDPAAYDDFRVELENVIFSHIPAAERLGCTSLSALLDFHSEQAKARLGVIRGALGTLNDSIADAERRAQAERQQQLRAALDARRAAWDAHQAVRPATVPAPSAVADGMAPLVEALSDRQRQEETLSGERFQAEKELERVVQLRARAQRLLERVGSLRSYLEAQRQAWSVDLSAVGLTFDEVVRCEVDSSAVASKEAELAASEAELRKALDPQSEDSLANRLDAIRHAIRGIRARLDEPQALYQSYLEEVQRWEEEGRRIEGDEASPGSIRHLQAQLDEFATLPAVLEKLRNERRGLLRDVHGEITKVLDVYRSLHRAVQEFIAEDPIVAGTLRIAFDVGVEAAGFDAGFVEFLDHRVGGSFFGKDQALGTLRGLVAGHDLGSPTGVEQFTEKVVAMLHHDYRSGTPTPVAPDSQILKTKNLARLYDYIFGLEYLQPQYKLVLGGRDLKELSPGEKGALLLVFYLLVDKDERPLLIDQPEENLDNQTVFSLLVPAMKAAKARRQVVVVTHNPNLAVVCDAEQIVWAQKDGVTNRVVYTAGAIENSQIKAPTVDVLEGTLPAFVNRERKYAT